jgi:hypothetical protein
LVTAGSALGQGQLVPRFSIIVRCSTRDTERPPLDHRFVTVDPASGRECTVKVFADGGRLKGCVSLDLAALKDRGFTRATFLDALNAIARLTSDDWAEDGIDAAVIDQLRSTFGEWHQ